MNKSIRQKINTDDGRYFQIENHNLNALEIIGYTFLIMALLVFLIFEKAGYKHAWLSWVFLLLGSVLAYLGVSKHKKENDT